MNELLNKKFQQKWNEHEAECSNRFEAETEAAASPAEARWRSLSSGVARARRRVPRRLLTASWILLSILRPRWKSFLCVQAIKQMIAVGGTSERCFVMIKGSAFLYLHKINSGLMAISARQTNPRTLIPHAIRMHERDTSCFLKKPNRLTRRRFE